MRPGSALLSSLPWLTMAMILSPLPGANAAAGVDEVGRPVLRHYTPGEHFRGLDSQRVTQDATGLIYFANNVDLLTYDGARWGFLGLPTDSAGVRQFTRTDDGTIYMAGAGVLGFLRGAGKTAEFVSLAGELPPQARNVDEFQCAVAVGQTVYFSDEEKIAIWRDGRFTVIPYPAAPHSHGPRLHRVGAIVYVTALGRGLARLTDRAVVPVADAPVLRENKIIAIAAGGHGALVLLTAEHGFFQLTPDGRVAPLATEMNRWLAGRRIFCAQRLADGSWVVGFSAASGDGGMRFGPDGRYLGPLDTSIGLVVKAVRDFFCDSEGGLWLGTDTGAARLEWPSPVSLFDAVNGLGQGAVSDVARYNGVVYATTTEGLFRLEPADRSGQTAHFERVRNKEFFALAAHPAGLLALGNGELFVVQPQGLISVARVPPGGGTLLRSTRDPDRVWLGTSRGLRAVRHTARGWSDEGAVAGFGEDCRELSEAADGAVWVATGKPELIRIAVGADISVAPQIERFAGGRGLPDPLRRVTLAEVDGDTAFVAGADRTLRRFDSPTKSFTAVRDWESLPAGATEECRTTAKGGAGTLWLAGADGIHQARRGSQASRRLPSLTTATVGAVTRLWEEDVAGGAVLWVCGANGLARVEVAGAFPAPVPFAAQLSATGVREGAALPPEHQPVVFNYYAPRQRHTSTVTYRTRLLGRDRDWSAWSSRRDSTFTNLPSGHYRFEVQARDPDGVLSAPAALGFTVLAPWWLTGWALAGYTMAGLGFIAGVVQLRTRALRQHAARLETVVTERTRQLAERTTELARQNTELVRLHQLELDEKISARLAEEKARLEVLRYQLNPHFLFNTLASISAALPAGRSTPRTMVERLAEFCRLTLHRPDERDWTTLGEELKLLRAYLEIELSRWGDLLDVEISADPALDRERLPHFLLLPLVENALKYGRATSPDRVGLRLAARRDRDGALVLEVANTGEWVEPAEKKRVASLGIGLDNLRERLARYYPRSHTFAVAHANGWVTATLRIVEPAVS